MPRSRSQIVGIHDPLLQLAMFGERARLAQQLVDQRGFAVIDMGDDRDVAQLRDGVGHGALSSTRIRRSG